MLCPACQVDLQMTERQGVEIDYCPKCRGIWLDRGELDKILERTARELEPAATPLPPKSHASSSPGASAPSHHDPRRAESRYRDDDHDHDRRYPHERRRKKSFLEQLFD